MKKIYLLAVLSTVFFLNSLAQIDLEYQTPPKEIMELADVKLPPGVNMNEEGTIAILMYQNQH